MARPRTPRPEPPGRPGTEGRAVYSLFGLNLASDFTFANRLLPGRRTPQLVFHCSDTPLDGRAWQGPPVFISPFRDAEGKPVLFLYRAEHDYLVRFNGIADFVIGADRIECHRLAATPTYLVEICLLGTVMALLLESKGRVALHGSVVCVGEAEGAAGQGAVAFLSGNRGGKSCLAASFVQAGCPLLSDDILAVSACGGRALALPGYAQMRLEPAEVEHFCGADRDFEIVHPEFSKRRVPVGVPGGLGPFCAEPQPLRAIYLLDREQAGGSAAPVRITPLGGAQALVELMRQGFEPELTEAMGFRDARLQALAALCRTVPVRRLAFASGFSRLAEVRRAVLRDVRAAAPARRSSGSPA